MRVFVGCKGFALPCCRRGWVFQKGGKNMIQWRQSVTSLTRDTSMGVSQHRKIIEEKKAKLKNLRFEETNWWNASQKELRQDYRKRGNGEEEEDGKFLSTVRVVANDACGGRRECGDCGIRVISESMADTFGTFIKLLEHKRSLRKNQELPGTSQCLPSFLLLKTQILQFASYWSTSLIVYYEKKFTKKRQKKVQGEVFFFQAVKPDAAVVRIASFHLIIPASAPSVSFSTRSSHSLARPSTDVKIPGLPFVCSRRMKLPSLYAKTCFHPSQFRGTPHIYFFFLFSFFFSTQSRNIYPFFPH